MKDEDYLVNIGAALQDAYGPVADTAGGEITAWRHETLEQPSKEEVLQLCKDYHKTHDYYYKRQEEYPAITEQLDAILKQLNYMQMSGQTDLVAEMDDLVGKWLAVKRKYPKE